MLDIPSWFTAKAGSAWLQLSLLTWKSVWTSTGLIEIHAPVKYQPILKHFAMNFEAEYQIVIM